MAEMDWASAGPDEPGHRAVDLQTDQPHPARVYDYLLGGKDNFAADRAAAEAGLRANPNSRIPPRENRAFLGRAVRYLAREAGISQFLDIGTGIPTSPNVHEIAQTIEPRARIVYVDNDPIVLAHARALLTSEPGGATAYLDQDLRNVAEIIRAAAGTLDFTEPVAVMLVGILHCIPDEDDPAGVIRQLMDAVPPGSYLVISHPANDINSPGVGRLASRLNELMPMKLRFRARAEVARFFDGLELVEPGLVRAPEWRPDSDADLDNPAAVWAGVARKN
jgi:SAM-dependent methyltransferase